MPASSSLLVACARYVANSLAPRLALLCLDGGGGGLLGLGGASLGTGVTRPAVLVATLVVPLVTLGLHVHAVDAGEVQRGHHVRGVFVDGDRRLEARDIGDQVHLALALLFLQLQGDAANRATRNALHQMGDETGHFVAHTLGRDDSNFFTDLLVGVEVEAELGIVALDDVAGCPLDEGGADASLGGKKGRGGSNDGGRSE